MGVARLYGGVIAVVSGLYSLWLSSTGMAFDAAGTLMAILGLVVLLHGVALFVVPDRLGDASGPLMVVWAVLMLLNQVWMATMTGPGTMDGGMGMNGGMDSGMGVVGGMGWNVGMLAIAVIMLASGVIMWTAENPQHGM